jgi:hypothetical protein
VCYSDSAIFTTITQPLITVVIEPFIDSTGHFLDFIVRYNDSTIFTAVTQLFLLQ